MQSYRSFRRRVEVYMRCCRRRGQEAVIEGAFLLMQQFGKTAWDACEEISLDELETPRAFDVLLEALDKLYRYDENVEQPNRCEEFFNAFCRKKGETLQDYLHRHRQLVLKLQEVQLPLPDGLVGWHLLSRAGIPQWQEPTVKSACGNKLEPKRVEEVLKQMFGADSRPHAKDIARVSRNVAGATYEAMVAEDDFGVDQYAIEDS